MLVFKDWLILYSNYDVTGLNGANWMEPTGGLTENLGTPGDPTGGSIEGQFGIGLQTLKEVNIQTLLNANRVEVCGNNFAIYLTFLRPANVKPQ